MEQRYGQLVGDLGTAQVRGVVANLLACALLLYPDFLEQARHGTGYLPDWITVTLAAVLFVLASTYTRTFRVLASVFLLLNIVYLHIARTWGPMELSARIEDVLQAPGYEALEYLGTYGTREIKIIVYALVCLAALFATRPLTTSRRIKTSSIAIALAALIVASLLNQPALYKHPYSALILAYKDARARFLRMETRKAALAKLSVEQVQCGRIYKNVLIVIGESVNRRHMSLYGYSKPTTPFLQSIHPLVFEAIAASNQTRLSIPLMLTSARVGTFESFFSLPSLVTDARACGYETFWISNQGRSGPNDSPNGSIGKEADHEWWRQTVGAQPDGIVMARVRQALASQAPRKAVFVHLIGSHLIYRYRYPEGFPLRPVKDVIDEYDESIRYTDTVLAQMYRVLPREGSLFIYVADHGELIRKSAAGIEQGHGYSPAYKAEYEAPLVIWSAEPQAAQTVHELTQGREINLDSFDGLVRFLLGITATPDLSFSRRVLEVSESSIVNFDDLQD
jgi:heptose-I-phosphate ethanolaminephosphotransferase